MKNRVSQIPIRDRKGTSIITSESTQPTPTKQMSPRSPKVIFRSKQTNCKKKNQLALIFPTMQEKQQRIKLLIEENQRLKEQNSVQDLVINTLQRINEEDLTRTNRVKTLNNIKPSTKNGEHHYKLKEKSKKEDNLLFTFFSPQSQPRSLGQFKLPKVFNVVPSKNKFFV